MRCGTRLERVVCRLDQVLGFIPTIAAAAVLLNWSTGRLQVMTFEQHRVPMAPNTAFVFLLTGIRVSADGEDKGGKEASVI